MVMKRYSNEKQTHTHRRRVPRRRGGVDSRRGRDVGRWVGKGRVGVRGRRGRVCFGLVWAGWAGSGRGSGFGGLEGKGREGKGREGEGDGCVPNYLPACQTDTEAGSEAKKHAVQVTASS